ncbi:hypothetical protein [Modestobacter sp. Leaf380]|uniref:hypothetical protein n=1 Tax=Modestobacter sp. Leaf380 TaxID=1736356 RepID=UPI00190FDFA5|nr:hypothetical protein [Modestobacter sp. Leaf380]
MDAAKAAAGRWAGYSGPVGGDTRAAFLLEHPSFVLPAPEGVRVVRVLSEGLMGAPLLTDHRRAVAAYAAARPLAWRWAPDGAAVELSCPGAAITVRFDELGRIGGIASTLGRTRVVGLQVPTPSVMLLPVTDGHTHSSPTAEERQP